ncbi:TIGR03016 family PEP-CTERM system-associated outer membrane protein [Sedimenticola hydrogenitrophicus]|uniref:TIGR03016 family PEP-CTERM system-associated outer membrane protein n=1 Tax=Sedimenticola hydrogenitrophicus TaxID=2967975 RepID=UPI0021A6E5A1|nr:TIGR03016 family PEP-CTERM system-associated outer membrane protein [Sedimenticola hydrogenitrophicus]
MLLLSMTVSAAEWTRSASINASAVYSDNINLVSTGKESEINGILTPSIALHGEGARANLDLVGALEINSQSGNNDSVNPRLQADANAELYERVAFLDFNATATQNAIDPLAVTGTDNLSNRGNKTTTYSYKFSPYLKHRYKGLAEMELRYTYNELSHSEDNVTDTSSEMFNLSIDSGSDFTRVTWGFDASRRTTDTDQGEVSRLSSLALRLGYRINRQWRLNGLVGDESNEFTSTQSSRDGSLWDIGATWTPSARTVLDFGIGERFFGSTRRLSLSHTSRRSILTASYTHELTDSTSLLSNQVVFPATDPFGQPIINSVTGDPFLISGNLATIGTSTFVDERLALSYTLRGRRTRLTLNADTSDQTFQDSTRKVSLTGLGASLSRTLSGKVSADVGLNWNQQEESGTGNRESDTWRLQAGLNQRLGQKTNLRLNYSYTDRSSNQAGQSYEENKLALTLIHTL